MRLRRLRIVWDSTKVILDLAAASADACPYLKSAVGFAVFIIKRCEDVRAVRREYRDLANLLQDFAMVLLDAMDRGKYGFRYPDTGNAEPPHESDERSSTSDDVMPPEVQRTLENVYDILKAVKSFFVAQDGKNLKKASRNVVWRFFSKDHDREHLQDLDRRLRQAIEKLKLQTQLGDSRRLRNTQRHVRAIKQQISRDAARREHEMSFLGRAFNRISHPMGSSQVSRGGRDIGQLLQRFMQEEAERRLADIQTYRSEQQQIMDQISAANRAWEHKRAQERHDDQREMNQVKTFCQELQQEVGQVRQWMSSTETQEVKDFGAFYKLLEATAVQVASMHETQAQRDRAQREMGEMLSNVSKHIQDTAQLAGAHKRESAMLPGLESDGHGGYAASTSGAVRHRKPLRTQTQPIPGGRPQGRGST